METQRQFGRLHLTAWRRLQSKKRLAPCCAVLQRDILRSNEGERTYKARGKETAEKRSIFAPNRTIPVLVNFARVHTGTRDSFHFLPTNDSLPWIIRSKAMRAISIFFRAAETLQRSNLCANLSKRWRNEVYTSLGSINNGLPLIESKEFISRLTFFSRRY